MNGMNVLYLAAECKPFSKVGGVGDVAGELPPALKKQGVAIEMATPLYGQIDSRFYNKKPVRQFSFPFKDEKGAVRIEKVTVHDGELNGVPIHFLKNETYFEHQYSRPYVYSNEIPFYDDVLRFSFFSEACLHLIQDKNPDIVHVNDWVLGYLFGRMVMEKSPAKRVFTVHNMGYQGNIGQETVQNWEIARIFRDADIGPLFADPRKEWKSVNALRLGLELSHRINTVSPHYCEEITQPEAPSRYFEGGKGLHRIAKRLRDAGKLVGILNGFEYVFDPTDAKFAEVLKWKRSLRKAISKTFADPEAFLLGFVGRAVEQKFKLLTEKLGDKSVLDHILELPGVNVAILASGLPEYESFLKGFAGRKNCSITLAFDQEMADQISRGSDVFLMPSLFEPCGIAQMESLSNATPPLVRWMGGLVDTVKPYNRVRGTGFGFGGSNREELIGNLIDTVRKTRAFFMEQKERFRQIQWNGFRERFMWSDTAKSYIENLYLPALVASRG